MRLLLVGINIITAFMDLQKSEIVQVRVMC